MGITFKENCPDIRNSKVINLVNELKNWGVNVLISDPWADPLDIQHNHGISLKEIDKTYQVDSIIVAVGHSEFRKLDAIKLRKLCSHSSPVIADIKSLYNRDDLAREGFDVFRL